MRAESKKIIREKKIVGVFDQENDTFRVRFEGNQGKDHVIPIRIIEGKIRPITIYPEDKNKRLRQRENED